VVAGLFDKGEGEFRPEVDYPAMATPRAAISRVAIHQGRPSFFSAGPRISLTFRRPTVCENAPTATKLSRPGPQASKGGALEERDQAWFFVVDFLPPVEEGLIAGRLHRTRLDSTPRSLLARRANQFPKAPTIRPREETGACGPRWRFDGPRPPLRLFPANAILPWILTHPGNTTVRDAVAVTSPARPAVRRRELGSVPTSTAGIESGRWGGRNFGPVQAGATVGKTLD